MRRFHFDHDATTPVDPRILERFVEIERTCPGNPGSLHAEGRRARGVVEAARDAVAAALSVDADHVVFVASGTEANNIIVQGAGDTTLPLLAAPVEHPSVLAAAAVRGLVAWRVDQSGRAEVETPEAPVGLVALAHGQNEVGTLQPVQAAVAVARALRVPLHVDASQTLGRCPLDDALRSADSLTFSLHKAGGLRGAAVLVDRNPATRPLLFGGGQERGRRPGTESVALIAACAFALTLAVEEQPQRAAAMLAARTAFLAELADFEHALLTPRQSLPNTAMVRFDGVDGRALLPALDMAGVAASLGSACSAGSPEPPAILRAMGLDERAAMTCVRFSFAHTTAPDDAAQGARVVKDVVSGLRARR